MTTPHEPIPARPSWLSIDDTAADDGAILTETQLVTGDAVLLDVRPVSFLSRAGACLLDVFIMFVVVIAVLIGAASFSTWGDDAVGALIAGLSLFMFFVWPVAWETATAGRSLGKMMIGLRVVRDDGGPIRFRHALIRGLLGYVDLWMSSGCVAIVSSLASQQGKRVGDRAAGTIVVSDRRARVYPLQIEVPPALTQWASYADVAALPTPLLGALRNYVQRSHLLSPEVRTSLEQRLLARVLRYVAPLPPPDVPAAAVLAAVMAKRYERGRQDIALRDARWRSVNQRLARLPHAPSGAAVTHRQDAPFDGPTPLT